jgi:hypothetical protein
MIAKVARLDSLYIKILLQSRLAIALAVLAYLPVIFSVNFESEAIALED